MVIAIRILDQILRDRFGYAQILFIFSGRRGIHCWVCDEQARKLTAEGRKSILDFLTIQRDADYTARMPKKMDGYLQQLYDNILLPAFEKHIIPEQEIFTNSRLMKRIPSQKKTWNEIKTTTSVYDVVFTFTYPRFDTKVTAGLNHLLKAPFCVHPKTGRICVPINPASVEEFRIEQVPTLDQLIGGSYQNIDHYVQEFERLAIK